MDSGSTMLYRPNSHRWRGRDVLVFDDVRTFEPTPHGIRICESLPTTGTITTVDTFQPVFRVERMREYYAPSKDDDDDVDTIFVDAVVTDGTDQVTTMEFETIPAKPICIGDLIQLEKFGTVTRCFNGCRGLHTTNCRCRKKMNLVCQQFKIVPDAVKMQAARDEYNSCARRKARGFHAQVPSNEVQTPEAIIISKSLSLDGKGVPNLDDSSVSDSDSLPDDETIEFTFEADCENESGLEPDITTTTEDLGISQYTIAKLNFFESESNPSFDIDVISAEKKTRESDYGEVVSEWTLTSDLEPHTATTTTTEDVGPSPNAIVKMNFYESEYNPSYAVDVISAEKKTRESDYGEVSEWTLSITDGKHSALAQISGYDQTSELSPGDRIKITKYEAANWYYEDRILIQQYEVLLHHRPGQHDGIVAFDKNVHGYSPDKKPLATSLTLDAAIVMKEAAVGSASCTNPTVCMQLTGLHSACRWVLSDGHQTVDAYLSLNGETTTSDLPAKTDIVKIQFSKASHKYGTTRYIL
jgi:hypothetical protein